MITSPADILGRIILGRYRVVQPLAKGGMGLVYLGRVEGAAGFAKPVVIKTVVPSLTRNAEVAGMFVREARILSNLQHPCIVGVLDFGKVDDAYMMVLEYVHGFHLGQWMRYLSDTGRSVQLDHALHITLRVLEALHYAHRLTRPDGTTMGIVHRDISPANILIDVCGRVRLHDFGIAHMADEASEYHTEVGTFKGTFGFAAPEALLGLPVTARSDLYSCAVVLYQVLAGKHPFRARTPVETISRTLHEVPPSLSTLRMDVPAPVSAAIDRALRKEPEDRFATAASFADALRAGMARTDDEIVRDFASVIAADFLGDMADRLGLESLAVRDQSWRQIQDGLRSHESMSLPRSDVGRPLSWQEDVPISPSAATLVAALEAPSMVSPSATTLVAAEPQSPGRKNALPDRLTNAPARHPPTPSKPKPRVVTVERHVSPSRRPSSKTLFWIGAGALGTASAFVMLTVGWFMTQRSTPLPAASVIVITRQPITDEGSGSAPSLGLAAGNLLPTVQSGSVTQGASTKPPSQAKTADTMAGAFSRSFQKQRARVEQCFLQHAADIEGHPQFAIRFTVDKRGTVEKADISPVTLAATELGQCVLTAARDTQFDPQSEPVTFTIPVTARKRP